MHKDELGVLTSSSLVIFFKIIVQGMEMWELLLIRSEKTWSLQGYSTILFMRLTYHVKPSITSDDKFEWFFIQI